MDEIINNMWEKYNNTSLLVRIIIGIILGLGLAFICPYSQWISVFGNLFVGALKAIAPILVFVLVISSLAQGNNKPDKRFARVIFFYIITTLLSAICSVAASFIFPQNLVLTNEAQAQSVPTGISEVIHNVLLNVVVNPLASLTEGNYLGILFWAIIFGIALKNIASDSTKQLLSDTSQCITYAVRWVINLAPLGIMGLVYAAVSSNGAEIFGIYGKMILMLAGCMAFVFFISNPIIVYIALKKNPYPLIFKCFKESGLTAFFTRSSAANIPINMTLCEKLGLDKDMYSVSIPLGATINMNGAAITITIMTLAAVHTLGIAVDIPTAIILSILATFAACGASGVAGGSLLLIPMACSLFGISNDIAMQVVGVGFIIGVIQDSLETALNSSSDVVFTATAEFRQWIKDGKELPEIIK